MKIKPIIAALRVAMFGVVAGRDLGRATTHDTTTYPYTSFTYRMSAGFPGDVTRTHPASIYAGVQHATLPVLYAGQACIADPTTNTLRGVGAGDTALTAVYGFAVRSYPFQQSASTAAYGAIPFGASPLPTNQPIDALQRGAILGQMNVGSAVVGKGSAVFIWCAATSGNHVQGGYEAAASAGNTMALDQSYTYNGPADANGVVEIVRA